MPSALRATVFVVGVLLAAHPALAQQMVPRALANLEGALGPEHESVAAVRENLGGFLKAQGRLQEAEPLLKEALATKERVSAPAQRWPTPSRSLATFTDCKENPTKPNRCSCGP